MSTTKPQAEEMLRQGFRYFNKFMLLIWRLGLSRWGMRNRYSGWIMVITHTGRKSGLSRRTPVNYAILDGDIYCAAGFGALADWYRSPHRTGRPRRPGLGVAGGDRGAWWGTAVAERQTERLNRGLKG